MALLALGLSHFNNQKAVTFSRSHVLFSMERKICHNVCSLDYAGMLWTPCHCSIIAYVRSVVIPSMPRTPTQSTEKSHPQMPIASIDLHEDVTPSAECSPSGCCNRSMCGRPPIAYQRKSIAAGPVGYPPYPGSLT